MFFQTKYSITGRITQHFEEIHVLHIVMNDLFVSNMG